MPRLPRLKVQGLVDKWVNVNRECVVLNEHEEHHDGSVRSNASSVRSAHSSATVRRRSSAAAATCNEEAVASPQQMLQPRLPPVGKDAAVPPATGFSAVSTSFRIHSKSKLRHDKSKAEKNSDADAPATSKTKKVVHSKLPKKSSRFRGRRRDRSDNDDNLDDSEHARNNCKGSPATPSASANGGSDDDEVTVTSVRTARTASSAYTASTYATQISSQVVFGPVIAAEEADDASVAVSTASSHSKRRKAARAAQAQAQAQAAQAVPPSVGFGAVSPAPTTAPAPLFHPHCQPTASTPGIMEPSPGVIFSPMGDGAVPCFPGGQPFPAPPAPGVPSVVPGSVLPAFSVPPQAPSLPGATPSPPVVRSPAPATTLPQQPPLPGTIVMEHNDWGKVDSSKPPEVVMPPPPPQKEQQSQQTSLMPSALSPPPASVMHIDHRRWGAPAPTLFPAVSADVPQTQPVVAMPPPLAPYPPLPPHLKAKAKSAAFSQRPVAVPGVKSSQEVAMQALEQYRQRSTGEPGRPRVDEVHVAGIFREAWPPMARAPPRRSAVAAQEADSDDETDCSVEIEARMRTGLALSSSQGERREPDAVESGVVAAPLVASKEDSETCDASQTSAEARMMEAAVILSTQLRTRA